MLVDREAQLASFAGWVADAAAAPGSTVLAEREAGYGKTSPVRVPVVNLVCPAPA